MNWRSVMESSTAWCASSRFWSRVAASHSYSKNHSRISVLSFSPPDGSAYIYTCICLPPHSVAWDSDDGGSLRHSNC